MKRTRTVALLVLGGVMAVMTSLPAMAQATTDELVVHAGKFTQKKTPVATKRFRYLDMATRTHPSSIRNAVVVYDYGLKKSRCDASQGTSAANCLRAPST